MTNLLGLIHFRENNVILNARITGPCEINSLITPEQFVPFELTVAMSKGRRSSVFECSNVLCSHISNAITMWIRY